MNDYKRELLETENYYNKLGYEKIQKKFRLYMKDYIINRNKKQK